MRHSFTTKYIFFYYPPHSTYKSTQELSNYKCNASLVSRYSLREILISWHLKKNAKTKFIVYVKQIFKKRFSKFSRLYNIH